MRSFAVLSALVIAVSSVLATPGSIPNTLIARQATATPQIPPECAASCATIEKITSCGVDLNCMCTNEMGQGMADCGACGIKYHANSADVNTYKAQFQASINSFAASCTEAGHKVGPFDVLSSSGTGTGASPASTNKANSAASVRTGGAFVGLVAVAMTLVL